MEGHGGVKPRRIGQDGITMTTMFPSNAAAGLTQQQAAKAAYRDFPPALHMRLSSVVGRLRAHLTHTPSPANRLASVVKLTNRDGGCGGK
jgi:hypothetical protein